MRRLLPLAAVALGVAGCGTSQTVTRSSTQKAAAPPAASTPAPAPAPAPAASGISTNLAVKPHIPVPSGAPPTKLVTRDVVTGKGPAIRSGQQATVRYVGVSYTTGKQFDASWDRGQDFPFPLGQGQVIPGWDQGIVGMRAGGRRELIIPPDLAYGPQGQPPTIQPNETLIFVVDLKRIG